MLRRFSRRLGAGWLTVVAIVAVAAGGGWALAASSGGVIKACAAKKGGALRVAKKCKHGERKLSWNIQGPQGPPGPQGPAGTSGASGTSGANGTNGTNGTGTSTTATTTEVVRQGTAVAVTAGHSAVAAASCNPGERAVGGGNSIQGSASSWAVADSFPTPGSTGSTPTGWRVDATNTSGSTLNLVAIVICISP
jgi:hypothetical protein